MIACGGPKRWRYVFTPDCMCPFAPVSSGVTTPSLPNSGGPSTSLFWFRRDAKRTRGASARRLLRIRPSAAPLRRERASSAATRGDFPYGKSVSQIVSSFTPLRFSANHCTSLSSLRMSSAGGALMMPCRSAGFDSVSQGISITTVVSVLCVYYTAYTQAQQQPLLPKLVRQKLIHVYVGESPPLRKRLHRT